MKHIPNLKKCNMRKKAGKELRLFSFGLIEKTLVEFLPKFFVIADIVYRHNMPPIRDPVSYRPPFGMFLYKYLHLRLL